MQLGPWPSFTFRFLRALSAVQPATLARVWLADVRASSLAVVEAFLTVWPKILVQGSSRDFLKPHGLPVSRPQNGVRPAIQFQSVGETVGIALSG